MTNQQRNLENYDKNYIIKYIATGLYYSKYHLNGVINKKEASRFRKEEATQFILNDNDRHGIVRFIAEELP